MRIRDCLIAVVLMVPVALNAASPPPRTSSFEYDATSGLLTKEIIEPGSPNFCLVAIYTHDAFGNRKDATTRNCNGSSGEAAAPTGDAVIQARMSATTYAAGSVLIGGATYNWSAGQFPTTTTNAIQHSESKKFDPRFGTVVELTGPNLLTTSWAYDGFGRKTLETRSDGNKTEWAYLFCSGFQGGTHACPPNGKYLVQVTPKNPSGTPNGAISKTYFDALNREIRAETEGFGDGILIYKDTYYDDKGRVSKVSRPYNSTTPVDCNATPSACTMVTYDPLGRVQAELQPATAAGIIKTTTDYNGLIVTTTVSNDGAGTGLPGNVPQIRVTTRNWVGQVVRVEQK